MPDSWPFGESCEDGVHLADVVHARQTKPESLGARLAVALAPEMAAQTRHRADELPDARRFLGGFGVF